MTPTQPVAETYRVVPGPSYTPAQLARARSYRTVEDAIRAMGDGIVLTQQARLVAFHERHLGLLQRRASTQT